MTEPRSTSGWLRWLAVVLAVAIVYVVTARLGLMLALPPEKKATAVWPPSGIALAALLLLGYRVWPGVWIGAFLANLWDGFDPTNPFPLSAHLFVSVGIATGSTLQALAGTFLVRRWTGSVRPFQRAAHALRFAGVAMLMCLIAATFGVVSLYLAGFAPVQAVTFLWWTWWLGDMTGVLTVGSFLLTWSRWPMLDWQLGRLAEAALLLLLLSALVSVVFGIISFPAALPAPLAYLVIPFLVWATFRFGLHGAATTLGLVSTFAVVGTAQATGLFAQPTVAASLLLLQVFMGAVSVTVLVMAAVLAEQHQAEHTAQRWEFVFDKATWAVAVADPADNTLKAVNPAFATMHGFTAEELVGRPLAELLAPASRSELPTHDRIANQRDDYVYESVHVRKDGSSFPCLAHVTTLKDVHGKVQFRAATFEDITRRKETEAALVESRQRYELAITGSNDGIWDWDIRNDRNYYSDRCLEMWGYHAGEVAQTSETWAGRLHPDDRERVLAAVHRHLTERVPYDVEYRGRTESGEWRWYRSRGQAVWGESGRPLRMAGSMTDITARKRTEERLRELNATLERRVEERTKAHREEEQRFRMAFDHAPIGLALVSPEGRWLRVNRSLCEIVGYSESELLATDFQSITHPDDLEADLGHVRRMLAGTIHTHQMEKRYFHKQGHVVYILLSVSLVRDAEGLPLHFISQIEDITRRRQAEDRIKSSLREKEVLLKEIHHRVKNNLQIVSSLLDLQADHTQDRQALEMFKDSRSRVKSMALIHERLYRSPDLARVNFGEYIRQLAEDLYHAYKVSDDEIELHVTVAVPPLPIDIAIPCGLLLNELMSNSLKHGFKAATEGWLRVALCGDGPNNVLTVADNGVGFPPGFDFRNTTSFGLQLVTMLVEQLQGRIELITGRGSEFVSTFPRKDNDHNGTSR